MDRRRLAGLGVIAIAMCLVTGWWLWCEPPTTLLIVRHAEREGGADALRSEGLARAEELVHVAEKVDVAAIYHSDTKRARDTARPMALALALTPIAYVAGDSAGLVETILREHRGQTVFVVGHSNTVPQIIRAAGGPSLPDIDEKEFDRLFTLTVCGCRRESASFLHLQYGARSP